MMKKTKYNFILHLTLLCLLCIVICAPSARASVSENELKAVFIEHFSRFIEWPDITPLNDTSEPFIITVIGDSPLTNTLAIVLANKTIKSKIVQIHHVLQPQHIGPCHILFIAEDKKNDIDRIIRETEKKPILTVGDTKGFAEHGVCINFYRQDDKIRFEINESSIAKSPLHASHLLLRQAKIVQPRKNSITDYFVSRTQHMEHVASLIHRSFNTHLYQ